MRTIRNISLNQNSRSQSDEATTPKSIFNMGYLSSFIGCRVEDIQLTYNEQTDSQIMTGIANTVEQANTSAPLSKATIVNILKIAGCEDKIIAGVIAHHMSQKNDNVTPDPHVVLISNIIKRLSIDNPDVNNIAQVVIKARSNYLQSEEFRENSVYFKKNKAFRLQNICNCFKNKN